MKIGILKYPGGHGDEELKYILRTYFNLEPVVLCHKLLETIDFDLIIIPGGFPCLDGESGTNSFEDSFNLNFLRNFAEKGGFILGFGNGFKMLCEAGLLPGKLVGNEANKYICKQVYIKLEGQHTVLTSELDKDYAYRIPLASYYANYIADENQLIDMRQDGQILFRFCDFTGRITEAVNYSGSTDNIAGVCNNSKNVFGMIVQPERAVIEFHGDADGGKLLEGILKALAKTV